MKLKSLLGWAVLVFIAYYLFTNPSGAGHNAGQLLEGLKHAGNSLATFLGSV